MLSAEYLEAERCVLAAYGLNRHSQTDAVWRSIEAVGEHEGRFLFYRIRLSSPPKMGRLPRLGGGELVLMDTDEMRRYLPMLDALARLYWGGGR